MNKYHIIRNAISPELTSFINQQVKIFRDTYYYNLGVDKSDLTYFSDKMTKQCFKAYGWSCTETLLEYLKPMVEEVSGKKLYPTYSYFRIYYKDSILPKHIDRPSCEYSVTLNTYYDPIPWEMCFDQDDGSEERVLLEPGDLAIYKGCEVPHWRPGNYLGNEMTQIFLHYVDADGPFKEFKYDCRDQLAIKPDIPSDKKLRELHETVGKEVLEQRKKYVYDS